MKKLISLLLATVLILSMAACAAQAPGGDLFDEPTEPAKVLEDDKVKLDGFFVDNSYVDSEGKPLKLVFVYLTFKAGETNYKVDAKYTKMKIGENEYDSDFYKRSNPYTPNYYYSSYIEEIFVGKSCKLLLTFKVAEGDLVAGKDVTLSDSEMPVAGLRFSTDDLVVCENHEEIGKLVDPEGAAQIADKREEADKATVKKVRKAVNGYYWTFYVTLGTSPMKYELEFKSSNKFELRTPLLNNSGTYEVTKGYIVLNYKTGGDAIEIPYEFKNGEINLDCSTPFSIYE